MDVPQSLPTADEAIPNAFGPDTRQDFHVLKDGDLFAVFSASGDINAPAIGPGEARSKDGLFYRDTRYLSRLSLMLNGTALVEMGHDAREDDAGFRSDLANTRLVDSLGTEFLEYELHVRRERFLSDGLYDRIVIKNFGLKPAALEVAIECWSDFRDIFEVRGAEPTERGELMPPSYRTGAIRFGYRTADNRHLLSEVAFDPAPHFEAGRAYISLSIPPNESRQILCTARVAEKASAAAGRDPSAARHGGGNLDEPAISRDTARQALRARLAHRAERTAGVTTSRASFNAWLERSSADLAMLTSELATGPYPYAGVPWFSVPFGRDGLITAFQTLWLDTNLAAGVLDFLASTQASEIDAFRDAEPGKILHEYRNGEMARTDAVPFRHYYGGIDQTLLFLILAQAYWRRTGDIGHILRLEPALRAALDWAKTYGDRDGDGFIEYERSSDTGLRNQGWKDSEDAIFHENGDLCASPVALVEVQGYYVAALRAAASLFEAIGRPDEAPPLREMADNLVVKIDTAFWDDDLGTYCIALDATDRPVRVSASNAGHLLFANAVLPHRVDRLVQTLSDPRLLSGWGIRTVAERSARYNPMGYHTGSIWPHDNSMIAYGAAAAGHTRLASQITSQLFEASCHFSEHRLPELWCGFSSDETCRPVAFPSACSPQAWAAGAPFLCLQACLDIDIDAPAKSIHIRHPVLPAGMDGLEIRNLKVGSLKTDLRYKTDRDGRVRVEPVNADAGLHIDMVSKTG